MLYLLWFSGIHRHGQNALRGWCFLTMVLVCALCSVFILESVLVQLYTSNPQLLDVVTVIGEMRLYDSSLFKIWQLWSYVLFHNDLLHLIVNIFFLLPLAMFWERLLGVWFALALLALLPGSVAVLMMSNVSLGDMGCSPLIMALFGALLLRGEHRQAEYRYLQWFGTRVSLRIFVKPLWWACAVYLSLDLLRFGLQMSDGISLLVYVGNLFVAAGVGASALSVLQQLRRQFLVQATA